MADSETAGTSGRRGMTAKLRDARWILAAAALSIGALGLAWALPGWALVVALVFVILIAGTVPAGRGDVEVVPKVDRTEPTLASISVEGLANAVSDPLIILDGSGTALHVNPAAEAAFSGLRQGTSVILRFRAPEMQALIEGLVISRRPATIDYAERVPVERWFKVTGAPAGEKDGVYVLVFKDQSETRRIDRMRADFIANASHELRTPLASVSGFIETLRGPARNDPAARDQFLQIMHNQTGRMARLIDDLLSLSRLEMMSAVDPTQKVDLAALIDSVADTLRPMAAESGVTLDIRHGAEETQVAGSRDELFQVFENLIENACKYGQTGGRVDVTVGKPSRGMVEVTVRDYGPGIPAEHLPRLTERFYRVDVETSRGQKGTGLGLAIVKHILTRHHARLSIRSEEGQGAAFTVHFPVA